MISMSRVTAVYRRDFSVPPVKAERAAHRSIIDWEGMQRQAARGLIPDPSPIQNSRKTLRDRIYVLARQGKIEVLQALEIGDYNSRVKAIAKYRDLCVEALQARGNRT